MAVVAGPVAASVSEMVVITESPIDHQITVTVTVVHAAVVAVAEGPVAATVSEVAVTVSPNKVTV